MSSQQGDAERVVETIDISGRDAEAAFRQGLMAEGAVGASPPLQAGGDAASPVEKPGSGATRIAPERLRQPRERIVADQKAAWLQLGNVIFQIRGHEGLAEEIAPGVTEPLFRIGVAAHEALKILESASDAAGDAPAPSRRRPASLNR